MNFFGRVELKLNYSAATHFEKPEKVHKTRKNRPKTGGFMVAEEGFEPTTFGL